MRTEEIWLTEEVLKEEEAFCCIRCGKPFAVRSAIDRISAQLAGHPMFQGEAITRLQMCEDCRVKDMFKKERGLVDVDRNPG